MSAYELRVWKDADALDLIEGVIRVNEALLSTMDSMADSLKDLYAECGAEGVDWDSAITFALSLQYAARARAEELKTEQAREW